MHLYTEAFMPSWPKRNKKGVSVHEIEKRPIFHDRYMLAESKDALYVAFMGTKQLRDMWTNARVRLAQLWPGMAQDGIDQVIWQC
jgi:hypothetical protein